VQFAGESAAQLKQLRSLQQPGVANFDDRFRRIQIAAHTKAVALFTRAQTATSAPLRTFAKQLLPVLEKHLAMAKALPQR
jgi:predicted outer membrane protein